MQSARRIRANIGHRFKRFRLYTLHSIRVPCDFIAAQILPFLQIRPTSAKFPKPFAAAIFNPALNSPPKISTIRLRFTPEQSSCSISERVVFCCCSCCQRQNARKVQDLRMACLCKKYPPPHSDGVYAADTTESVCAGDGEPIRRIVRSGAGDSAVYA